MTTLATSSTPKAADPGHSWEWFRLHAEQRLTTFNFYLVIFGALVAIAVHSVEKQLFYVSLLVGCVGLAVTFLFFKLDERNRYLIKIAEELLQSEMSKPIHDCAISPTLIERANTKPKGMLSFRQIFNGLFLIVAAASLVTLAYSIYVLNFG